MTDTGAGTAQNGTDTSETQKTAGSKPQENKIRKNLTKFEKKHENLKKIVRLIREEIILYNHM